MWVEDNAQKKVPLSGLLFHEKVKRMYDHLAGVSGAGNTSDAGMSGPSLFQASRGWFDSFEKRCGLHKIKLTDEHASADHKAAETCPAQLAQLIEERGYVLKQVFNADEIGLFLKEMPMRTFISK